MLEFRKMELVNEYGIWDSSCDNYIGEFWFCEDDGWHFSLYEEDTGISISEMKILVSKMEQLTEQTTKEGYFKQQKELLDGNN